MALSFQRELRVVFREAIFLMVVESNLGYNADRLTRSCIDADRNTHGLTDDKVTMGSTLDRISFGVFTHHRVPLLRAFSDICEQQRFNYAGNMVVLTEHSQRTTFGTQMSNAQVRDHMRQRLEGQVKKLKRVEKISDNPIGKVQVGVTSAIDHRQKRIAGVRDDLILVIGIVCNAFRLLSRDKITASTRLQWVRDRIWQREFIH